MSTVTSHCRRGLLALLSLILMLALTPAFTPTAAFAEDIGTDAAGEAAATTDESEADGGENATDQAPDTDASPVEADEAQEPDGEDTVFAPMADTTWYNSALSSFTLTTAEQLLGLSEYVNFQGITFAGKTINLGANVDFATADALAPIGTPAKPFLGTFNGGTYSIFNLKLAIPASCQYIGFFGYVGASGQIKNLNLVSGAITVDVSAANGPQIRFVGSLAGFCAGPVDSCTSTTVINLTSQRAAIDKPASGTDTRTTADIGAIREVGGLVGHLDANLSNCTYAGTLNIASSSNVLEFMTYTTGEIGGLVGRAGSPDDIVSVVPDISDCTNNANLIFNVSGSGGLDRFSNQLYSASFAVGGIVGYTSGSVTRCANNGDVRTSPADASASGSGYQPTAGYGASAAGGIVGSLRGSGFDVMATTPQHEVTSDPGFTLWQSTAPTKPAYVGVYDSTNTGLVIGLTGVGGIVGSSGSFTQLSGDGNIGDVKGCRWNKPFVGGIIGNSRGDVRYCFNRGNIWSVTGAGYFCAGIAGGLTSAVNAATPDNLRYPALEMTGCYVVGQVMLTSAGYRTGILAGESSGYLHDNVYMPGVAIDNKVVSDDTGVLGNNPLMQIADIKGAKGIALLNIYAASVGGWDTFYLPDSANTNAGFPIAAHGFNTTGIDLDGAGAVAVLASGGNALFSTQLDPVPVLTVTVGSETLVQNADFYVIAQGGTSGATPLMGTYQATVVGMGRYSGTMTATVPYQIDKGNIADCTIVVQQKIFNWNRQNPAEHPDWVQLYDAAGVLVDSSQYTVVDLCDGSDGTTATGGRYYDYINVHGADYKYDVRVQAAPSSSYYTGAVTQKVFRLEWAEMMWVATVTNPPRPESVHYGNILFNGQAVSSFIPARDDHTGAKLRLAYTGVAIRPTVDSVTYLGRELSDGTTAEYWKAPTLYDYRYLYGNPNPEEGTDLTIGNQVNVTADLNKPECMTLRFTTAGNFKNYENVYYLIVPRPLDGSLPAGVSGGGMSVTYGVDSAYAYTGSAIRPAVQLRIGGNLISADQYSVSYGANTNKGSGAGSVTITSASANLSGSVTLTFDINTPAVSPFAGKVVTLSTAQAGQRNLDIPNRSTTQGAQAILWDGNLGANQRYYIGDAGDGTCYLRNVNSGMVLDIYGAGISNGAAIIQWPYKGSDNQKWNIVQNANGTYTFTSVLNPAYCIDVNGGSGANGATIILWTLGVNKANQQWQMNEITPVRANGFYYIRTMGAGSRSLDIEANSLGNEARMLLWDYHGRANQRFYLQYQPATGYYIITNQNSGKSIDVQYGSISSGAQVIQYDVHGRLNQQWAIGSNGSGSLYIISAQSGLSLDVYGGDVGNNGRIITWPYHGRYNQQWSIEPVS